MCWNRVRQGNGWALMKSRDISFLFV
jgi:hypothetical protein